MWPACAAACSEHGRRRAWLKQGAARGGAGPRRLRRRRGRGLVEWRPWRLPAESFLGSEQFWFSVGIVFSVAAKGRSGRPNRWK